MSQRPPSHPPDLVEDFVGKTHSDLDGTLAVLAEHPSIVNAAWDWGGGDWETALGGAAHMGRRDIALALLDAGARLDVFAAAMLGYTDVVRAALAVNPAILHAPGPHGIPLVTHAKAGEDEAAAVLAFLEEQLTATG